MAVHGWCPKELTLSMKTGQRQFFYLLI